MPSIRDSESSKLPIGSRMPSFNLKDVTGDFISSDNLSGKAILVAFTCNHCPYVKGSEQMMIETIREFIPKGLCSIAISANDPIQYPEDSYIEMQKHSRELDLPYPYLFDESQSVAKAFDAQCTPEVYIFNTDKKLIFHGTINDSLRDASKVTVNHLKIALKQIFNNEEVNPSFVKPLGCSIKWKI